MQKLLFTLLLALSLPLVSSAQTLSDLESKIAALLAEIQTLQSELQTLKSTEVTPAIPQTSFSTFFTTTLGKGSEGSEVTALQQYLAKDPTLYPEGLISGYFGSLTEAAVKRFQQKHNIVSSGTPATTGYGTVGPKTRALLNSLLTTPSSTPVTPSPTPTPTPTPIVTNTPNRSPNLSITGDRFVTLPNKVTLTAVATDDGKPSSTPASPAGRLTYFWSKASGPGTVTFSSLTTKDTTVSFSATGTYQISTTVSDGDLFASYTITLIVSPASTTATSTPPATTLPPPTLTFTASKTTLTKGTATTLTWSSINAISCTATQGWSGSKTSSGSATLTPQTTTTYTLLCKGGGGDQVSKSVTVAVVGTSPEPVPIPTSGWQAVPLITAESRARGNTGGEGGQVIESIAIDSTGNFMVIGTDVGGLFRSENGGKNWEPANIGMDSPGVRSIVIDPNNSDRVLVVGTPGYSDLSYLDSGGIWLSVDRGRTWSQKLRSVTTSDYDLNEIAWDPSSVSGGMSKIAYWSASGPYDRGFYKTTDGGVTWNKIHEGTEYADGSVAVHPTKGYIYLGNTDGFYRSTDKGATFTKVMDGSVRGVSAGKSEPDLVAIVLDTAVWVSTDAGATFTKRAGNGIPNYGRGPYGIRVSPANANYMMFAYNGPPGYYWDQRMWYSHDGGNTWAQPITDNTDVFFGNLSGDSDGPNAKSRAWHPTNPNILFVGAAGWVLKSTDGGVHVSHSNDGNNGSLVSYTWTFNPFNPDLLAFGIQDWMGAFTTDGGYTWKTLSTLTDQIGRKHGYGAYMFSTSRLFFGMADNWEDVRTLYASSDGGKTWTSPGPTTGDNYPAVSGDPGDPNVAFFANWRTANQGSTWQEMSGADHVFTYNPTGGKELYGTNGNSVVKSNDHGVTWSKVFEAPSTIWDVAYDQTRNRIYAAIGEGNQSSHLYQWENGTLSDITDRLPSDQDGKKAARTVAVDPVDPRVVYAGNYNGWRILESVAVMRSTDAGMTWTSLTLKPGDMGIDGGGRNTNTLRVNPVTRALWVTNEDQGIWKYPAP